MSRRKRAPGAAERVSHLVALDASNVMIRLAARHDDMVSLFSRLRNRAPFLETLHTRFETIAFSELAALAPSAQLATNDFYELLGELRWYLQYTEDMPLKVRQHVSQHLTRLAASYKRLVNELGPAHADGTAIVEVKRATARRHR